MPNTMTLIASYTVGSGGTSSIDFTSIPSTYTDLVIMMSLRSTEAASVTGVSLQFNGDTTAGNYTWLRTYGTGSVTASNTNLNIVLIDSANNTASTFANAYAYIPNYTSSNQKSLSSDSVSENNATEAYATIGAGKWTGTNAISSIKLLISGGNYAQYSTAYLYGVKNA